MTFQTAKTQSRLRINSTVARVALAVALTLSANGAMAAPSQVHKTIAPAHAVHTRAVTAANYRQWGPAANYGQFTQRPYTIADFLAAFPGIAPIVTQAMRGAGSHARVTSGGDNSQVFDTPSAPVEVDNSQSQAAIEASDAATQQMDQDTFQMDESLNQ
jgi:hypothetical protein